MPGERSINKGDYRYGFNGKEDDRSWGMQNVQDYGFRLYNPSIGKFLSVDPLSPDYPMLTPYQFAANTPIWAIDLDGLEEKGQVKAVDYFFFDDYCASEKACISDGSIDYHIPLPSETADNTVGNNRYFYKVGEKQLIDENNLWKEDGAGKILLDDNGQPVLNVITVPDYIEMNSPMTFKGGDGNSGGYEQLSSVKHKDFEKAFLAAKKNHGIKDNPYGLNGALSGGKGSLILSLIKESLPRGALDFKYQLNLDTKTLYSAGGVYYNKNEMGNYLYGRALARLGYSAEDASIIANFGTFGGDVNARNNNHSILDAIKAARKSDEPWEYDAVLDGWSDYTKKTGKMQESEHVENVDMYNPDSTGNN